MMRTLFIACVAAVVGFGFVSAQDPAVRQRQQLQQQVIEWLMQNTRVQAGLTDEQFERYREIARRSIANSNAIQNRERNLWLALEGQMRPGIAADDDSVEALIDSLVTIPGQRVDLQRSDQREYAEFLTPVQRAQLMLSHRRFENNIRQILQRRLPNRPGLDSRLP